MTLWETRTNNIINKYKQLLKQENVKLDDINIGIKYYYVYPSFELERRYKTAVKIFFNLHKEIDKFPKYCRGLIYSKLKQ